MGELIEGFQVQSHTPDPPATLFCHERNKLHQKMGLSFMWPFWLNKPWAPAL